MFKLLKKGTLLFFLLAMCTYNVNTMPISQNDSEAAVDQEDIVTKGNVTDEIQSNENGEKSEPPISIGADVYTTPIATDKTFSQYEDLISSDQASEKEPDYKQDAVKYTDIPKKGSVPCNVRGWWSLAYVYIGIGICVVAVLGVIGFMMYYKRYRTLEDQKRDQNANQI